MKKMLVSYARFIVRHSYVFMSIVSVICTIVTILPFVCHEIPSFSDPTAGFETRGTSLAHRFIAWENLIDESRPSRRLAVDPKEIEDQIRMNQTYNNQTWTKRPQSSKKQTNKHKLKHTKNKKINGTINNKTSKLKLADINSTTNGPWDYGKNISYEDENVIILKEQSRKQWKALKGLQIESNSWIHSNFASSTCGAPLPDYAHLVITTKDNSSLLTYDNVANMCKFQAYLVNQDREVYHNLCQRSIYAEEICCPVWSVPNYLALMSRKLSCENLTQNDVEESIAILKVCAEYFHNYTLTASCDTDVCKVPSYCTHHNAVFNLLFYLVDSNAFTPPTFTNTFVENVMLFFPLPASSTVMPYYDILESSNLSHNNTLNIPAIDFGLKNALFDLWIIEDTWLIALGGIFVFLCVLIYTKSVLLTVLLFVAIGYSLGIAYFLYVYVFNLNFFPFMNLLVIVIVIGIGADDAFIYKKVWVMDSKRLVSDNVAADENVVENVKNMANASENLLVKALEETLKHASVTMFVTTLTTAVAFYASYVSYIPAINCFSVFAGTAVLVNFLLMVTWLPASVFIVDVKLRKIRFKIFDVISKNIYEMCDDITVSFNKYILFCVTKFHFLLVLAFGAIGIYSIVAVFYSPGLQLPDSRQFQLFDTSHPFEQYDLKYQSKFVFEKSSKDLGTGGRMPLRWIWGVKAIDNGNHMDPFSTGQLIFDENFSISEPQSQQWLLNFCQHVKSQPFYLQTYGLMLPNCFIETFIHYFMSRQCVDNIDNVDRTPCCETSYFPYKKEVFELCIIKAMESLYQSRREMYMPGAAGPKFLRGSTPPRIVAMVIEFESVVPYSMSYSEMNDFFLQVENWTQQELKTAPPGLKDGWFLSDLQFYDLQSTLAQGTIMALILSASLGFLVLLPATKSFVISICALTAMIFSATVTIAILVWSGWKLNILESVAISTSAGLAVDFSLHYALSYTSAKGRKISRIQHAVNSSAGPTAAAALTTGFAGIFLLHSSLLPYSQIGTFLALIMSISWSYATFFLCSLLNIVGNDLLHKKIVKNRKSAGRPRVSSVCSAVADMESHELEHLAESNRTIPTHSQSPSSLSATTVLMHEEVDSAHARLEIKC